MRWRWPPSTSPARPCWLEVDAADVGEHLSADAEGDRVVTHQFECRRPGYVGWRWSVTVARASRQKTVTVDEIVLVPGAEAIVAPTWVPYRERIQPGDLSPGDLLPVADDDPRLVPTYSFGDDPLDADARTQIRTVAKDLGLGRIRTLSPEGHELAAQRWYDGDAGPEARSRSPRPSRARRAASWCASRARWPSRSACAPTATPTTTAGSSPSATAAAPTPRCGSPSGTSRMPLPEPVIDELDDELETLLSRALRLRQSTAASRSAVRARLRRRQYSRPSRPSPQPAAHVQTIQPRPASCEAAVERAAGRRSRRPTARPRPGPCGRRRRRAARRRPRGRCDCRSRGSSAGRRAAPRGHRRRSALPSGAGALACCRP